MSKRNYLNVVSAGVVAFGTLALGLVSVLPVASAANAAEKSNEFSAGDYEKNLEANPNADAMRKEMAEKAPYDTPEVSTPSVTSSNRYVDPNFGEPAEKAVEDNHSTRFNQYDERTGEIAKANNLGGGQNVGLKDVTNNDAANSNAPVVTTEAQSQQTAADKSADQGAVKGAGKGQQQVKKGHHKFGAPNTGYEF